MRNEVNLIKIKISRSKQSLPTYIHLREAFWNQDEKNKDSTEANIEAFENGLRNEFGQNLRQKLIYSFQQALSGDDEMSHRDLAYEFFHYLRNSERPESYEKLLSILPLFQRQIDTPGFKKAYDRYILATQMHFRTEIIGYSSLEIGLLISSVEKASKLFDGEYDTFLGFLEAYVPQAFSNSTPFDSTMCHEMKFEYETSPEFKMNFSSHQQQKDGAQLPVVASQPMTRIDQAEQRLDRLYKIINGTLLVPVAVSLVVIYLGFKMYTDIATTQSQMMKPIIEHQLKLLEEDRKRMLDKPSKTETQPNSKKDAL